MRALLDIFSGVKPEGKKVDLSSVIDIESVNKLKDEAVTKWNFNNFIPFEYQAALWHDMEKRDFIERGFIVWPRRAGKTIFMILYIVIQSLRKASTTKLHTIVYGIVYPDLANGKEVAWNDLDHYTNGLPGKKTDKTRGQVSYIVKSKHRIDVKVIIRIVGLQNMEGRRGGGYDGIVIDERGSIPDGFKKVVNPMIGDKVRKPTFLINVGTPFEEGDFWDDYDKYKKEESKGSLEYYTFWSNYEKLKHLDEDQYEKFKIEMSPEEFDIEINCKRGVKTGAKYFSESIENLYKQNRVRQLNDIPSVKKVVICDIGGTTSKSKDLFSLWFMQYNANTGRFEFIDYEELASVDTDKIFNVIQSKQYSIGQIILPWDGATGLESTQSTLRKLFPAVQVDVLTRTTKLQGIRAARSFFAKCEFDMYKTIVGMNCLKNYSKEWDKKKRIYLVSPRHDKYSHGAEAFIYAALADINKLILVSHDFDIYNKKRVQFSESYNPNEGYEVEHGNSF